MRKSLLLVTLLGAGITAQAQDSLRTTHLDELVISATRVETPLQDVDRTVTLIGANEIRNSLYQNVAELIASKTPGIYFIGQQQNPGANQSLFIRGTNSNHVRVMINGVPLSDPSSPGASLDLSELSLVNVERIEILKGSHGTMYGSSGVGGVINIVTKRAPDDISLNVGIQAGTFGEGTSSRITSAEINKNLGAGFYLGAGIENVSIKGLDAVVTNNESEYPLADKDNFEKTDAFGRIGYASETDQVEVFFKNTSQMADLDQGAFVNDDNFTLDFNRSFLSHSWQHDFSKFQLRWTGGITSMERTILNDSSLIADGIYDGNHLTTLNEGRTITEEIQGSFLWNRHDALIGFGLSQNEMNQEIKSYNSFFGLFESSLKDLSLETNQNYVFVRTGLNFDVLRVGIGARYNEHSDYGSQWSYDINPAYHFSEKGSLFSSISRGFNNPSLYQLFDPSAGNNKLTPELSTALELGLKLAVTEELNLSISVFNNHVDNTIEYVNLWDKNTHVSELSFLDSFGSRYINLGELETSGLEFSLDYESQKIGFNLNYSHMNGEFMFKNTDIPTEIETTSHVQILSNGAFLDGSSQDELIRRPAEILKLNTRFTPLSKWSLFLNYTYNSSRNDAFYDANLGPFGANGSVPIDAYGLIDFRTTYKFNDRLLTGFRVENLLNASYQEIQGFSTRGRGIYFKINYQLVK